MPDSPCWPRDSLKDYLNGSADDQRLSAIESHLAHCPTCEQTVLELERDPDTLLQAVRGQLPQSTAGQSQANSENDSQPSVVKRAVDAVKDFAATSSAPSGPLEKLGKIGLQQIGAYELVRPLGRGGMGLVMLARHVTLKKQVAIKILPSLIGDRPELVRRFQREIITAGGLSHPSIVHATDAGAEQGTHYLVMEYIDGLDLSRIARLGGTLPIADACELMRQTALGLSYAHAQGVVHRDIKPSNLMLDTTGRVKILDFGLAQLNLWDEAAVELTTVGQLMGTLDYMAPEQAERVGPVDYRADLYALGATLFRLLTGRAPLAAAPQMTLLEKVRLLGTQSAPLVSTLRDDCPAELVKLIEQLLSREPGQRPASAAHVAEALQPLCAGHDVAWLLKRCREQSDSVAMEEEAAPQHPPVSLPPPPAKPPRRSWLVWAGLAPLAIVAGVLIILETQKGQLVIESDVADVKVNVLQNGKVYQQLEVQPGAQSTRLFADKYSIDLQAQSDSVAIDQTSVEIKRGATVVARITQKPSPLPQPQLPPQESTVALESNRDKQSEVLSRQTLFMNLSAAPLTQSLKSLSQRIGYPIEYDQADIESTGVTLDSPTSIYVKDSTDADTALRMLLYKLKLAYTVTDKAIIVGSRERIEKLDGKPFMRWPLPNDQSQPAAPATAAGSFWPNRVAQSSPPDPAPTAPTQTALQASSPGEPIFAGQTLAKWLDVLERDLDSKTRLDTLPAITQLGKQADDPTRQRINRALASAIRSMNNQIQTTSDVDRLTVITESNGGSTSSSFVNALRRVNAPGPERGFDVLRSQVFLDEHGQPLPGSLSLLLSPVLARDLASEACRWLMHDDVFNSMDEETAWLALTFLETCLVDQNDDFVKALPERIRAQPKLGLAAMLMLRPPRDATMRPALKALEEEIVKAARDALLDDQSSPKVVALAAARLAETSTNIELYRPELIDKLKGRLEGLAKDHSRLLDGFRLSPPGVAMRTFQIRDMLTPWQRIRFDSQRQRATPIVANVGSEIVSVIDLINRIKAARDLDEPLAAVYERLFEQAKPLTIELRKLGNTNQQLWRSSLSWPFSHDQIGGFPRPFSDYPIEAWRTVKIVVELNDLRTEQKLFNMHFSDLVSSFEAEVEVATYDEDGDQKISRTETSQLYDWGRDQNGDKFVTVDELITSQERQIRFGFVGDLINRLDVTHDYALTKAEAVPTFTEEAFAEMDADSDGNVTLNEFADYRVKHPEATAKVETSFSPALQPDDARRTWAERQIAKYDKNKDGQLTADEWSSMIVKPKEGTDANGDGIITAEEMARGR